MSSNTTLEQPAALGADLSPGTGDPVFDLGPRELHHSRQAVRGSRTLQPDWRSPLPAMIWSTLIVLAAVLLSRRLAGGFSADDGSVTAACLAATLAMLLSLSANLLYQSRPSGSGRPHRKFLPAVVSLGTPFVLAVVLLPNDSTTGISYLATLFVLATAVVILTGEPDRGRASGHTRARTRQRLPHNSPGPATVVEDVVPEQPVLRAGERSTGRTALTAPAMTGAGPASQWTSRTESAEGNERVEGSVRVQFTAGQRQAVVHIPFVPPLADAPKVDCEVIDPVPARTRVTASRAYGARIEVKRTEALDSPATLEVAFCATAVARRERAA